MLLEKVVKGHIGDWCCNVSGEEHGEAPEGGLAGVGINAALSAFSLSLQKVPTCPIGFKAYGLWQIWTVSLSS